MVKLLCCVTSLALITIPLLLLYQRSMRLFSSYLMIKPPLNPVCPIMTSHNDAMSHDISETILLIGSVLILLMETLFDSIPICPLSLNYFSAGCRSPSTWLSRRYGLAKSMISTPSWLTLTYKIFDTIFDIIHRDGVSNSCFIHHSKF